MVDRSTGSAQELHSSELLLRIAMRGVIDAESARDLSTRAGLGVAGLNRLMAEGTLTDDEGLLYLSDAGDQRLTKQLRAQVAPGDAAAVAAFAAEFELLDLQVKKAVTGWQRATRDGDAAGQVEAVQNWLEADARLRVAAGQSQVVARVFGSCLARLESARESVLDGEVGQLSGTDDSSYHSVWFLMHEMLLRTLGRERTG